VVQNYAYELDYPGEGFYYVPICPATLRPYSVDRRERKPWKDCAEMKYGPLNQQLSVMNYFIQFVMGFERYPENASEARGRQCPGHVSRGRQTVQSL
jgi:hypothetical protein